MMRFPTLQTERCICCGRQGARTPAQAESTNLRLARLTPDQISSHAPEDVRRKLEELYRNRKPVRAGFCAMCDDAGCDGEAQCKVDAQAWVGMDMTQALQAAWEEARGVGSLE